ncbi:MAG: LysR family transcriptional regulator [Myxococcota bacterium]
MKTGLELNFHHLRYFWAVAREGNLTRTAKQLRVAPSALSAQIRQLEEQLDEPLFTRDGRRLELTEAGKIALSFAEEIFSAGGQLVSTLREGREQRQSFRVGSVATLSRNFLRSFVAPLLEQPEVRVRLEAGSLDELLTRLSNHALDLVLSNRQPPRALERRYRCRRLARQPVSIVASRRPPRFRFPRDLEAHRVVVPGPESEVRTEFESLCERHQLEVNVMAEVDDMPTIRLLARDTDALAFVPTVVVRDELERGLLHELCVVPDVFETFYAITVDRRFQHPLLRSLLTRDEDALLAVAGR